MILTVEVNTKKLDKALRLVPKVLKYEIGDALDHISRKFLKIFKQTRLQGPPGIKARPHWGIFSHFYRAFFLSRDIEGMGVEIFTDSKVARIHEEGATLKDPGGGKLAVPFSREYRPKMYTSSGRLRRRYRQPSALAKLIPITLKGKQFLAKKKKGGKEPEPLFVLKNKVRIKPRLGFQSTWEKMENANIAIINKAVGKALKKV